MPVHRSLLLWEGEDYWYEDAYLLALDHWLHRYGISRAYTALTEDQYSGNTTLTVSGDSESHPNACVRDDRTGLVWNKAPSSAVGPYTNGLLYWDDHCVQLAHATPTTPFSAGAIVTQDVTGAQGVIRTVDETADRLALYNVTGTFNHTNDINDDAGGGPAAVTGSRIGAKKDIWSYARAARMAGLSGHYDWRIPNIFELISIMIYNATKGNASPDTTFFTMPAVLSDYVWSSTHDNDWQAFVARFSNGSIFFGGGGTKSNSLNYAYLVRGPLLDEALPCRLPSTGQTVMSDAHFPDDGFFRIGVERAFTVLDSGQYQYDSAWTANGDPGPSAIANACVRDENTGLMWSKETTPYACAWKDTSGKRADVFEHLRLANSKGLGGHRDWRIPTAFEAMSIIDLDEFRAFDAYFSNPTNSFWTVTPRPDSPSTIVFRYTGGLIGGGENRFSASRYVRFVRGGSKDEDL